MNTYLSEIAPAPISIEEPFGLSMDYRALIDMADLQNVVSMADRYWPEIYLHERDELDYVVKTGGTPVYVVSIMPAREDGDLRATAREVIRRLAFGFNDYAAREIVGRYHRDLERAGVNRPLDDDVTRNAAALRKARMRVMASEERAKWLEVENFIAKMKGHSE